MNTYDFKQNINTAFVSLSKDTDFTGVTLACEDGHQVDAHKVILTSSSLFFLNILTRNKNAHPLIYMKGMKSEDLVAIVDFLYYGEANIYQENLDSFLRIAEELELKGLNDDGGGGEGGVKEEIDYKTSQQKRPFTQKKTGILETKIPLQEKLNPSQSYSEDQINSSREVALPKQHFSGDMKELGEQIETMIGRGENMVRGSQKQMIKAFVCKVCGKEGQKTNIKDHIEANHIEGISIPCSLCEKTFRSRDSLRHHYKRSHNQHLNWTQ